MKRYRTPRTFGMAYVPWDYNLASRVLGATAAEFFMRYCMLHVYHDPCFAWNEV